MPVLTLTAAGNRQAMATGSLPSQIACNRCTIELLTGTSIYIGLQRPGGVSDTVSSTVYDVVLNASNPSFTIGPVSDGRNGVMLSSTYWDSGTNGATIAISPISV